MEKIRLYVPISYLNSVFESGDSDLNNAPKPPIFWVSKPDGWNSLQLAEIFVSSDTYHRWIRNGANSRMILKD